MLKDLHTHSSFCDGKNTPGEMVEAAIAKGLTVFGVCVHSYTAFDTSYCVRREDIPRFIAQMHFLRAQHWDSIRVLCGVEQDYFSGEPTDGFDYVIGSVHYLNCGGEYIPVDESADVLRAACGKHFGGDIYALCEAYYRTVADVVNGTGCDIIGHFDLITKFNEGNVLFDERHPRYIAAWRAAADRLLATGVPFEINTGAISRGYRTTPYPSAEIQEYIRRHGGSFVLSSDAHSTETIAFGFDEKASPQGEG